MRRPKGTFTLRTHWGFLVSLYSLGKALYSQSYYLIEIPETGLRDHLLSQAGLLGLNIKAVASSVGQEVLTLPSGKLGTNHSKGLQNQVHY